ncbi:MAG: NADH-quinone oxidoreductase subunit NuoH [Candidatus Marinimicrobia bacterium]|nr:NADH-quinone oxidoreductase subunit NuoH [Candidatus Neomarinimicrobiota bacterium]
MIDMFELLAIIIKVLVVFAGTLVGIMIMTLAERRVAGFIQYRLGPNRVGFGGMLQPIADGLKFFSKEDVIPGQANRPLFLLAPLAVMIPALMTFAVIPFGAPMEIAGRVVKLQVADINIGLLYILALTSIGVYGLVLAGWSAGSKYPQLGGLRSSAQLISYELAMGLAIIGVIMISGGLTLNQIIAYQQETGWNIWKQPIAAFIFLITIYAETNRLPFDLTEAEQELVGGYHTEYSAFKFAMFFLSEYANMITAAAFMVCLFFGGWDVPFIDEAALGGWGVLLSVASFLGKTAFFLFLYILVRWTLPRFRYDQLMRLGWKFLLPLALLNVFLTGLVLAVKG